MLMLKKGGVISTLFFRHFLWCSFLLSSGILFFPEFAFSQCVGGAGANVICRNDGNMLGSAQFGFDPRRQLLPAVLNTNPDFGPCFTCSDGSIEATAGSLTDSFVGALRLPGFANQGDFARGPEEQDMVLPTAPGGSGFDGIFSLPLPPFDSFVFVDSEIVTDPLTRP